MLQIEPPRTPIDHKKLLTVEEAAAYTGIGINRIRMLYRRHPELKVRKNRRIFIDRVEFEKFLDAATHL